MDFKKEDLAKIKLRLIYQITTVFLCVMQSFFYSEYFTGDIYPYMIYYNYFSLENVLHKML